MSLGPGSRTHEEGGPFEGLVPGLWRVRVLAVRVPEVLGHVLLLVPWAGRVVALLSLLHR